MLKARPRRSVAALAKLRAVLNFGSAAGTARAVVCQREPNHERTMMEKNLNASQNG
jgi:hypothetical protein